jgi:hypothetical protein
MCALTRGRYQQHRAEGAVASSVCWQASVSEWLRHHRDSVLCQRCPTLPSPLGYLDQFAHCRD